MPGEIWAYNLATKSGLAMGEWLEVGRFGFSLSESPFNGGPIMDMESGSLMTGIEDFLQLSNPLPDGLTAGALRAILGAYSHAASAASGEGHAGALSVAGEHMVVPLDVMRAFGGDAFSAGQEGLHGHLSADHALLNPMLDPGPVVFA